METMISSVTSKVEELFFSLRESPEKYFNEPVPSMFNLLNDIRDEILKLPNSSSKLLLSLITMEFCIRSMLPKFIKNDVLELIKPNFFEAINEDFSLLSKIEKFSNSQKEQIIFSAEVLKKYTEDLTPELYKLTEKIYGKLIINE